MTTAGTGDGGGVRALRALTAVVALYALVMQAFLGGIAALPASASLALPFDMPCLGTAGRNDPAMPQAPVHQHACCCPTAHPVAGPPPMPTITAIVWPQSRVVRLAWLGGNVAPARAPPGIRASARAPPRA